MVAVEDQRDKVGKSGVQQSDFWVGSLLNSFFPTCRGENWGITPLEIKHLALGLSSFSSKRHLSSMLALITSTVSTLSPHEGKQVSMELKHEFD
jgi:hypothetical protein